MNNRIYYLSENLPCSKTKNIFQKEHLKYLANQSIYLQYVYNSIIFQDFPIFPVPNLLVNDIIKNAFILKEQKYFVSDIITKFSKNFNNYQLFCNGLFDLQKLNNNAHIKLKYVNGQLISNNNALIRSIDNFFNCQLIINKNIINNNIKLKTAIQHELIHWLQTEINGTSLRKHGLWTSLTYLDFFKTQFFKYILSLINIEEITYLFSEREFQPYCSNACQYLLDMYNFLIKKDNTLTKDRFFNNFNNCLNNFENFKIACNNFKSTSQSYYVQLLIFCKLCQLCIYENRYDLYLKEVLFDHLKNN